MPLLALQRYIWRVSFVVPLVAGLLVAGLAFGATRYAFYFFFPALAICVLVSLAVDTHNVLVTINSISGQIASGHWEMLRLTTLERSQIINAEYSIAQVRAWRATALEVGLHAFVGITYFFSFGFNQLAYGSRYWDELNLFLSFAALVGVILAFIAEPIWRMQAISAVALSISAQGGSTSSAALTAFGAVVGTRIVEATLLWSALFGSFRIFVLVLSYVRDFDRTLSNLMLCAATLFTTALLAFFFRVVGRLALRRALFAAFHPRA